MKRLKYLYALRHPHQSEPAYIGQTYHPRQRYKEHLRGPLDVDKWIREMMAQGIEIVMDILDCKRVGYNKRERELIDASKSPVLLNRKIPVNI
jgi:hypothetical protein